MICGQGPAPAAATIDAFRALGLDLVPGTGPSRRACRARSTPGCTLLRDFGTWELADVLAFAIGYARDGFPSTPGIVRAIARIEPSWTTSVALWSRRARLRNPLLADTYERLARVGRGHARGADRRRAGRLVPRLGGGGDRRAVACRPSTAPARPRRLAAGDDLAAFAASRSPVSLDFRGWTVFKTGPWGQGPVFLQQLALLDGVELGPFLGVEHVHTVIEGAKLAFADREAWYGDSAPVPLELLLSREYADERRALIGHERLARAAARAAGAAAVRADAARGRARASASRRAATPATSTSPTASATS